MTQRKRIEAQLKSQEIRLQDHITLTLEEGGQKVEISGPYRGMYNPLESLAVGNRDLDIHAIDPHSIQKVSKGD